MIRQLFTGLLLIMAFSQCTSDPKSTEEAPLTVRLECEFHDQETDWPMNEVYLFVNEQKIKVGEIGPCKTFDKANYAAYGIPDTALAACGGPREFDFLYVIKEENTLKVFQNAKEGVVFEIKLKS